VLLSLVVNSGMPYKVISSVDVDLSKYADQFWTKLHACPSIFQAGRTLVLIALTCDDAGGAIGRW